MSHPTKRVRVDTAAVATAQYYNTTGTVPSSFQLSADLSYLITTQPNCTVAAFELPQECTENEIYDAFIRCGQVKSIQKVCGGRAALIEFPEISTPTRLVHWAKINPFFIGVCRVRLEFSSQTITAPANIMKPQLNENSMAKDTTPNSVLHLDIRNAEYPITVNVLKAICSRHGTLQRIYIGKVNVDKSLEALVEFATVEEATKAREHLDGADIYSGCCSLSVSFSKMKKIHVTKNDNEQWDFTESKEGLLPNAAAGQRTLLPNATNGHTEQQSTPTAAVQQAPPPPPSSVPPVPPVPPMAYQQPYYGYSMPPGQYMQPPGYYPPMMPGQPMSTYSNPAMPYGMQPPMPSPYYQQPGYQYYPQQQPPAQQQMPPQMPTATVRTAPQIMPTPPPVHHVTPAGIGVGHSTSNLNSTSVAAARNTDMSIFHAERGAVLVVSNLPEGINCDHLFNVICLYGNIARIKFLKSRPGCAIVQMGSKEAAELVSQHLEGASIFGQVIQFHPSEQIEVQEHAGLGTLPDGSPVMKNYMTDSNNRFRNAVVAAKSRILAPTRTLHFFNAPLNFSPEDMCHVFSDCGVKRPPRIVVFTAKPGQKTSLGLAEWDTIGESLDALALANHRPIHIVGFAHPFHLKLAFSPKPISDDRAGQSMINYPAPPMQISRGPQLNTPRVVTVPAPTATAGKASEPGSSSPPPFDVRAVEAEEAAYLESNGAVIAGCKREHSPTPPPSTSKASPLPSTHSPSLVHQPPKTPEEEREEESKDAHTEAHEAGAVTFNEADELHQEQEGIASSSELSDENVDNGRFRENLKAVDEGAGDEEDDIPYVPTGYSPLGVTQFGILFTYWGRGKLKVCTSLWKSGLSITLQQAENRS
uniref:Heterogeneous nuclear ribonucleoprotein l n=1 Tax=Echinococcus granulosus TaxID=6210 RepID=A0A068WS74_ECHGR|nr:heterogeneous nuclear ribonucleoprotein l [Echinococcus granulosus]